MSIKNALKNDVFKKISRKKLRKGSNGFHAFFLKHNIFPTDRV
jgi:hypothetical protein